MQGEMRLLQSVQDEQVAYHTNIGEGAFHSDGILTLEPTTDWVEVGPGGRIECFTITYEQFNTLPDPPYAFGYVQLDGADTAIGGYFKGIDLTDPARAAEKLKIGTRVMTRFADKRVGDVLDFWFELT